MAPRIEWSTVATGVLVVAAVALSAVSLVNVGMSLSSRNNYDLISAAASNSDRQAKPVYDAKRGILAKKDENYITLAHPGWEKPVEVLVAETECPPEKLESLISKAGEGFFVNVQYEIKVQGDVQTHLARSCPQISGRYTSGQYQAAMAALAPKK